jgi:glycosyltransferase involved in cell wall biosynthesis
MDMAPARISVIRQHYVPQDTRVLREVSALLEDGHQVDLICLRKAGEPAFERRNRLTVRRLAVPRGAGRSARYLIAYARFFVRAAALVSVLHLRHPYRVVQVHSLPDVLVFAAAVPRLLGARVLLDMQECMPEFYATKFTTGMEHPAVRLIAAMEQRSIAFADLVVTPTSQLREVFVQRGAAPEKITVIMDGADERIFHPRPEVRPAPDRFTLISHGTVEERYGLDTLVEAVASLRTEIPELQVKIFGDGSDLPRLHRLAAEREVADRVWFSEGFVPFDELVEALAAADVGVVAMKRDVFRDLTLASKAFDFIAMGIPMLISRTRSVEETFSPDSVELFESGDPADLARAIRRLYHDPARRARFARQQAEWHRWPYHRSRYLEVVHRLLAPQRQGDPVNRGVSRDAT